MSPFTSTILSIIFLVAGAVAVYTMSALQGAKVTNTKAYKLVHMVAGWVFAALFLVIFFFMAARVRIYWEESSPRISIHVALSMALLALVIVKVSIKRLFPLLGKHYFMLGILTYSLSFAMVGITAGYYIIWRYEERSVASQEKLGVDMLELNLGKELFIEKCTTCHLLKEIMTPRSPGAWAKVVSEMIEIAEPRIKPAEGEQILNYLSKTHGPVITGKAGATPVELHCLPCHEATEIYRQEHGRTGWTQIVRQMRQYDAELIPEDKIDDIVDYIMEKKQK